MSKKIKKIGNFVINLETRMGFLMRDILAKKFESIMKNDIKIQNAKIRKVYESIFQSVNYRIYGKTIENHPLYQIFNHDFETLYLFLEKHSYQRYIKKFLFYYKFIPIKLWKILEQELSVNVFQAKTEEEVYAFQSLQYLKQELNNINTPYNLQWLQKVYDKINKNLEGKR